LWKDTGLITPHETWDVLSDVTPDFSRILRHGGYIEKPVANETSNYTAKMSGYLIAPGTGDFRFYVASSDLVALYISNTTSTDNLVRLEHCHGGQTGDGCRSEYISMVKGEAYYIVVLHHHQAETEAGNHLKFSLASPKTSLTSQQTTFSQQEEQVIYLKDNKRDETQTVTITGTLPSNFHFTINGDNRGVEFATNDAVVQWPKDFTEMLNPMCTYSPGDYVQKTRKYYGGEETPVQRLTGMSGYQSYDKDAYCGSGSNRDGGHLLKGDQIDLITYRWACFAQKGLAIRGELWALLKYYHINNNKWTDHWWRVADDLIKSEEWTYRCFDLLTMWDNIYGDQRDGSKAFYLKDLYTPFDYTYKVYSLIDEVRFSKEEIFITRTPAAPKGDMVMREMKVEDISSDGNMAYELIYLQYSCPTMRFPLFGIASSTENATCTLTELNTADSVEIQAYLANITNMEATFHCDDWDAATTILISRQQNMSLGLLGTWSMTYNNTILNLPPYIEQWDLIPLVEAAWGFACSIDYWKYCYEKHYSFKWNCKGEGGDHPAIVVGMDNLISDDTVVDAVNWNPEYHQGELVYTYMGPDFFQTVEVDPQVQLKVNGYGAWCDAANCAYTTDAALNPEVTNMAQAALATAWQLTLTGNGFTDQADTSVELSNGDACNVMTVSAEEIVCKITNVKAGDYNVKVYVKTKAEVTYTSGALTAMVPLVIDSTSIATGSLGGGTSLGITGNLKICLA
jgi:hypothetical protein